MPRSFASISPTRCRPVSGRRGRDHLQLRHGPGPAEGETLTLSVAAETDEDPARLQDVVGRHLLRFAFREALAIDWQPVA